MSIKSWFNNHLERDYNNHAGNDEAKNVLYRIMHSNIFNRTLSWNRDTGNFDRWIPSNVLFHSSFTATEITAEWLSEFFSNECEGEFSVYIKSLTGEQLASDLSKGLPANYFDDLNVDEDTLSVLFIDGINAVPSDQLIYLKSLIQNHVFRTVDEEKGTSVEKKYLQFLFTIVVEKDVENKNLLPAWLLNSCRHVE